MIPIGNSGFGYTEHDSRPQGAGIGGSKARTRTVTVKNIETGKTIFIVKGVHTRYRGGSDRSSTGEKTFLGLNERYYHFHVTHGSTQWGQVQSDGAVLKPDRTILKHIDFYPLYIKKAPVVVPSKAPVIPVIEPQITTISPKPKIKTEVKELSWWKKIINWIIKILNR